MSFQMTTRQYVDKSKTVTRRLGWDDIKVGEIQNGVEKSQGLKKGEKVKRLGQHRVVSSRWEPLRDITPEDVIKEGFPEMTPDEFVRMFCEHNRNREWKGPGGKRRKGCTPDSPVNRIEFKHL